MWEALASAGFVMLIYAGSRWVFRELKSEIGNPFDNVRRLRERSRERRRDD